MKPKKSMLKFRCPYPDTQIGKKNNGTLNYMKGEIYMQPWVAPTSTETRLILDENFEMCDYNNLDFE